MTPTLSKDKLITFRICPSEYARVRTACAKLGIRSVSAFARAAVDHMMNGMGDTPFTEQVHELRGHVHVLRQRIDELSLIVRPERNR